MSNSSVDGHTGAAPFPRSRQARSDGEIHPSHQTWPARARGKEVAKLHGKEPRRTGITLLDGLLIPASGRIDIRKNRVITKKATRSSKRRAFAELFEQGLRAALFSDALMHSGEPADHRRIPGSQRSCLFFVSDGFGHPILL